MVKINNIFKCLILLFNIFFTSCSTPYFISYKYNIKLYDNGKIIGEWNNCSLHEYAMVTDNYLRFKTEFGESKLISGGSIIIEAVPQYPINYNKNVQIKNTTYKDSLKITFNKLIILQDSLKHELKHTINKSDKTVINKKLKETKKNIRFVFDQYYNLYHTHPNK